MVYLRRLGSSLCCAAGPPFCICSYWHQTPGPSLPPAPPTPAHPCPPRPGPSLPPPDSSIPPTPAPAPWQPRVCSLCLWFCFCFTVGSLVPHFGSTYKWCGICLSLSDLCDLSFWFTSLSMIASGCIHALADGSILFFFLWLTNIPLYIYVPNLFIHSSVDGHFHGFRVLVIVNSASSNSTGAWTRVSVYLFLSVENIYFKIYWIFKH